MKKQYILTEEEVTEAIRKLKELRMASLMCRDAGDSEFNREFYLKAKGFEQALQVLGIVK